MTAHLCTETTPGCYRCELRNDEMAAIAAEDQADAQAAWTEYRDDFLGSGNRTQLRRREFIAGFIAGRQS